MIILLLFLLPQFFPVCNTKEYVDKFDRFLISCHTTDFECFKRQYKSLRDHVLLGNSALAINFYEPFVFKYGDTGTCVKVMGLEESELVAIQIDSTTKEYSMALELPLRIQQIRNTSKTCMEPDNVFQDTKLHTGSLKKFTGNATIQVAYPYSLRKKKGDVYMLLEDENLDVILDIPDLSQYDVESELERKLYEWSEWAYEMMQHVDVAKHVVLPYTGQLRTLLERLPLHRFILLYPEEDFSDIQFMFSESFVH